MRKAGEQGHAQAEGALGLQYEHGYGVPQDFVEAYKWYNPGVAGGFMNAVEWRSSILEKMTPQQVAEGQRRSSEFKPVQRDSGMTKSPPVEK